MAAKSSFLDTFMGVSSPNGNNYVRLAHVSPNPFVAVSAPCHDAESAVKGFYVGYTSGIAYGTTPFSKVTGWALNATTPYPAGTKMVLWGVK